MGIGYCQLGVAMLATHRENQRKEKQGENYPGHFLSSSVASHLVIGIKITTTPSTNKISVMARGSVQLFAFLSVHVAGIGGDIINQVCQL